MDQKRYRELCYKYGKKPANNFTDITHNTNQSDCFDVLKLLYECLVAINQDRIISRACLQLLAKSENWGGLE